MTARDSWCTPIWLTNAMGLFDLDPCANEFSTVQARCTVDQRGDGLFGESGMVKTGTSPGVMELGHDARVFINPPYSRGQVVRWVEHWIGTDFTFLLRWDPSTAWFRRLIAQTTLVWFPHQRINFEPPPGVTASSNPFPHALYMASAGPNLPELAELGTFFIPKGYHA